MTTEESPEQQGEPLANRIARQAAEDANRAKREYGPTGEPEQQVGAWGAQAEVAKLIEERDRLREALVAVEHALAEGGTE